MKNRNFTPLLEATIQAAFEEAKQSGADAVTPVHLFLGLMCEGAGLTKRLLADIGIREEVARRAMNKRQGVYSSKHGEEPGLSKFSIRAIEIAEEIAKGAPVSSFHLLATVLHPSINGNGELTQLMSDLGYSLNDVREALMERLTYEIECSEPTSKDAHYHQKQRMQQPVFRRTSSPNLPQFLATFGKDLTYLAETGQLDPVVGRDNEIQRAVRTLLRRRKNNPCFVGKAGVGKTAIAEGLAQRIADGMVPKHLQKCRIIELNVGTLISGTKYRGDFEERITGIIKEATVNKEYILFFDEMHTLFDGGGSEAPGMSAANILKPALARGDISVIGATTMEEYRKSIEKDAALERRFQCITIEEPSVEETIAILTNLRRKYEDHHEITIEDEAIRAAVELSERYITGRQLPDKAVDVLDEAASKIQMMNRYQMNKDDIATVISEMTGIPAGSIGEDEGKRLVSLEESLHAQVIGQDNAVSAVARAIRRNRAGLKDANRPVGSFLFLGPTGVGKTELSLALSDVLYLQKKSIVRIDMSEYMESNSVSKLIGAAPGYIGFDSGETLTEKITRKPYAVLLFDEIEKAHPEVWNVMLQILDAGTLTDASGKTVSFKNTTIVMTSNVGAQQLVSPAKSLGFSASTNDELPKDKVLAELKKTFRPELLNRFDEIIVFDKLTRENTVEIATKMLKELADKVQRAGLTVTFTPEAIQMLAEKGFDTAYGARPLRRVIQREVEDEIANLMLASSVEFGDLIECDFLNDALVFQVKKAVVAV